MVLFWCPELPVAGPTEHGIAPATGSLTAPIELSTGRKAYFVGKPNPLIMRHAMMKLGASLFSTASSALLSRAGTSIPPSM